MPATHADLAPRQGASADTVQGASADTVVAAAIPRIRGSCDSDRGIDEVP